MTDTNVYPLYAKKVSKNLSEAGFENIVITVEAGEKSKSWQTLGNVVSQIADFGLTRGDGLIALEAGLSEIWRTVRFALYARNLVCSVSDFASCTG